MAKYSFEFKLNVVQEYLAGNGGYGFLAKKHGIKSESQLQRWVNNYHEFGEEGLLRKRENQKYSVQFKLNAIELYQISEMSYREVANQLDIHNPSLVANWMQAFRKEGIDGLSKRKGRPPTLTTEENKKIGPESKKIPDINEVTNDKERIKELEKRVRELEIKNAFLKELRKLRKQEAQQRRMKQSPKSSPASEDPSN